MDSKNKEKEKPTEEKKEEKVEASTMVDSAYVAAERLEAANKKTEELIVRQEELMAKQALAGKAEAGTEPEKPKESTDEEYAKKVMANEIQTEDT